MQNDCRLLARLPGSRHPLPNIAPADNGDEISPDDLDGKR